MTQYQRHGYSQPNSPDLSCLGFFLEIRPFPCTGKMAASIQSPQLFHPFPLSISRDYDNEHDLLQHILITRVQKDTVFLITLCKILNTKSCIQFYSMYNTNHSHLLY